MKLTPRNVAAASVLALLAAGCGAGQPAASSQHGSSPAGRPPTSSPAGGALGGSPPSTAAPPRKLTACLVANTGGIHDRAVNQAAWQGVQAAARSAPGIISGRHLASASAADYTPNISKFAGSGCGIIVTVGLLMADNTLAAARQHPGQKFAIVDSAFPHRVKNLDALLFETAQDGFLGGYLAAGMTRTGKVATFGGEKLPTVTGYMDGFWDGVQYYNRRHHARVKVLGWNEKAQTGRYTSSITSSFGFELGGTAAGRADTRALIGDGADVIFPAAANVEAGAARAVREADAARGGRPVRMLGVQTDGCRSIPHYCRYLLSSVTIGVSQAVRTAVIAAANGTFTGGSYHGTLANGGVALAPYHDFAGQIPAALRAEIAALRAQIVSGKIRPATASPLS